MANAQITTNQLEEKLLDREIKEICQKLTGIGEQIRNVFKKYEPMKGKFSDELQKFLVEQLQLAESNYSFGDYITKATAYIHPSWIPDGLKKAILKWAVQDFIEKVDSIQGLQVV